VINPYLIPLDDWAVQLQVDYPNDGIPKLNSEETWEEWAAKVVECPTFSGAGSPSPYQFSDWREWAASVILTAGG
jgi:hypothetical protein